MPHAIEPSGWGRSRKRECAGGRSFTTNNWMRCGSVRKEVRRELLAEAKKHPAWKRLCQIPSIGPIRSAVLLGILQTPHRFRIKRPLWTYSGLGIETQSSADHRSVDGQLERAKKQTSIRGLNRNCNHDLKNLFKGAAIVAATNPVRCRSSTQPAGQGHPAGNGTSDPGQEDCHHRVDPVEERSELRRPISEITNSLSVRALPLHLWGFLWRWPSSSRDTLVRGRVSAKVRRGVLGHSSHATLVPLGQPEKAMGHEPA